MEEQAKSVNFDEEPILSDTHDQVVGLQEKVVQLTECAAHLRTELFGEQESSKGRGSLSEVAGGQVNALRSAVGDLRDKLGNLENEINELRSNFRV